MVTVHDFRWLDELRAANYEKPIEDRIAKVRAIDVVPYQWGVLCEFEGREPFVNTIVSIRWDDSGSDKLWMMLDTHNFLSAGPQETLDLVSTMGSWKRLPKEVQDRALYKHSQVMALMSQRATAKVAAP